MNTKQKKALLIFSSLLFMCAVFVIYVRTADLLHNYITADGYYKEVTLLTRIGGYVTAAGGLLSVLFGYIFMRGLPTTPDNKSIALLFANASLAFSLLICGCSLAVDAILSGSIPATSPAYATAIAFGALAILGMGYFVCNFVFVRTKSKAAAFFGVCVALSLVAYVMHLYYEPLSPLNSPVKLLKQMSLISTALFLLNEAGFAIGKKYQPGYIGFALSCAFLSLCDALPNLVVGIITREPLGNGYSFVGDILVLAALVYAVIRIITMSASRPEEAMLFVESLQSKADEVEDDRAATEDTERLLFEFSGGVQTSLFDSGDEDDASETEEADESEIDVEAEEETEPSAIESSDVKEEASDNL